MSQPTWTNEVNQRIQIVMRQVNSLRDWAKQMGLPETQAYAMIDPYNEILKSLYTEDLQLAQILDKSDFVIGAYGETIKHGQAPVSIILELLKDTKEQVLNIAQALSGTFDRATKRNLEPNVYGFAPGSIYIGFKVPEPTKEYLYGDDPVYQALVNALKTLGVASRLISEDSTPEEIEQAIPNSKVRAVAIKAIHDFAPTKQSGIDRVVLSGSALGMGEENTAILTSNTKPMARKMMSSQKKPSKSIIKGIVSNINMENQEITIKYENREEFVEGARNLIDHSVVVKDAGKPLESETASDLNAISKSQQPLDL